MTDTADCVIVGASFAGLAAAKTLVEAGLKVTVVDRKPEAGAKTHTTGIIVKEAAEQLAILRELPPALVRRIQGVRLYAPNLKHVDLAAPGYYFLATDTPGVMRWLAERVERAGARLAWRTPFQGAARVDGGFDLGPLGRTRYLVGADGPHSAVARSFGLGQNRCFLDGIEHEYAGVELPHADRMHCFFDRRLAPGYIAWALAGVDVLQVGLARRGDADSHAKAALAAFIGKIAPVVDLRGVKPAAVRAGKIPCDGLVSPVAAPGVLLVGDAAGMVSPLTAGGIHTALRHGAAAGAAIAQHLGGRAADPSGWFVDSYPRFRMKRLVRRCYETFQSDTLVNLTLGSWPVRAAAGLVYFHRRDAFEPPATHVDTKPLESRESDSAGPG